MLDIKWIRENPEKFDAAMKARGVVCESAKILILMDDLRKIDAQIIQEKNALKKLDAKLYHHLRQASECLA